MRAQHRLAFGHACRAAASSPPSRLATSAALDTSALMPSTISCNRSSTRYPSSLMLPTNSSASSSLARVTGRAARSGRSRWSLRSRVAAVTGSKYSFSSCSSRRRRRRIRRGGSPPSRSRPCAASSFGSSAAGSVSVRFLFLFFLRLDHLEERDSSHSSCLRCCCRSSSGMYSRSIA